MSSIVSLDIETIPDEAQMAYLMQQSAADPEQFRAPSTYKDPDKIAEYVAKKRADYQDGLVKKCSLDPMYGRIACVAMWDGSDGGTISLQETGDDEADLLRQVWGVLSDVSGLVTFNGAGFDLRWLRIRSSILRVPMSGRFEARRGSYWPHCDLMQILADWERDRWRGLAETCRVFGVRCEGKESGMDGSQVYQYVQDGRWGEVEAYNLSDAKATWELFTILRAAGWVPPIEATQTGMDGHGRRAA